MTRKLLIVESPAKCKTIEGYLGPDWSVKATMGHIRALKEDLEGIGFVSTRELSQVWSPTYEQLASKKDAISYLKRAVRDVAADDVYLGTDDDREGEAIAWHACVVLGLDPSKTHRIIFHNITKTEILAAVAKPSHIDINKFNAQQARTMLDLLIGFTLSPCLWKGLGSGSPKGLSAGRCQTPALRVIYERDIEIESYLNVLTWRIQATTESLTWRSMTDLPDEAGARVVLEEILALPPKKGSVLIIKDRVERIATHGAPAPFITSSLQQAASSRHSMNPKDAMRAAQKLYEAGHITYMRTDNPVLSDVARIMVEELIVERWGEEFVGPVDISTKAKKPKKATMTAPAPAQAAHEAIRPTHIEVSDSTTLIDMGPNEQLLYNLIWTRTVQSVMAAETRDTVRIVATIASLSLETTWDRTRFAGWRILETERHLDLKGETEANAEANAEFVKRTSIVVGSTIPWKSITASEHRASPPSRYTQAELIGVLEKRGVGRPSTYATLVETVLEREYVERFTTAPTTVTVHGIELVDRVLKPTTTTVQVGGERDKMRTTTLGRMVIRWLLDTFGDIVESAFTADMEHKLDEISHGTRPWTTILNDTWAMYAERYARVMGSGSGSGFGVVDFGGGYKFVNSRAKGRLFVLEIDGQKPRFAQVSESLTTQPTRADAEAAFATATIGVATEGEPLGTLEGEPVHLKTGRFGPYVAWRGLNISLKIGQDTTMDTITPLLLAKAHPPADAVDHTVGPFRIKRGPYGLFMYRTGGRGKPEFINIPEGTAWERLTVEGAEALYASLKKTAKLKKRTYAKTKPVAQIADLD